jgi:hypothetical protein
MRELLLDVETLWVASMDGISRLTQRRKAAKKSTTQLAVAFENQSNLLMSPQVQPKSFVTTVAESNNANEGSEGYVDKPTSVAGPFVA